MLRPLLILIPVVAIVAAVLIFKPEKPVKPEQLFWQGVAMTLQQPGLTCSSTDNSGGTSSLETVSVDLQSKYRARSVTQIKEASSGLSETVEEIVNGQDQYIRYNRLQAPKATDGKVYDTSKIVNVWGKSTSPQGQYPSLYGQTVFGYCVLPLADLSSTQADKLIASAQKLHVFSVNFSASKRQMQASQAVQTYAVSIQPVAYVTWSRQVAAAAGISTLDNIDPAQYGKSKAKNVQMSINIASKQISEISFTGTAHRAMLSDYGTRPSFEIPTKTIPASELQSRLQQ